MDNGLQSTIDRLGDARVLVVGDLILDRYTWGNVTRVSPEAPIVVLHADEHEVRPGGAASVAALVRHLGADVTVAGVVGHDANGNTLKRLIADAAIDQQLVFADAERPTTTKERFLGRAVGRHPHQILRVDQEACKSISHHLERRIIKGLRRQLPDHQALLVSDYAKGVCTERLLKAAIAAARDLDVPIVIDPARLTSFDRYRGATAVTPNRTEAELVSGRTIRVPEDAFETGTDLCRLYGFQRAFVTLDRDGIALTDREEGGAPWHAPVRCRQVYDITGAGDTVLAVIGLCLATGVDSRTAAQIANVAGGLQVERLGVAPISLPELRAELLALNQKSSDDLTSYATTNQPQPTG